MDGIKCCILIILLFLLSSCGTMEYSLNRYNKNDEHFVCKDRICSRGYFFGESDFKILFSEISIIGKKVYVKGAAKEFGTLGNQGIGYCGVFLGKARIDDKIFLQKQINQTDENGDFKFKIKLKEGDFIVFHTVGYRPEIYQLQQHKMPCK